MLLDNRLGKQGSMPHILLTTYGWLSQNSLVFESKSCPARIVLERASIHAIEIVEVTSRPRELQYGLLRALEELWRTTAKIQARR